MRRDWVITQDTREKKPLLFPRTLSFLDPSHCPTKMRAIRVNIHTVKKKLDTADYALDGDLTGTLIERKGSLREIAKNCLHFKDRQRFIHCLERLSGECENPIILLEGSPLTMLRPVEGVPKPYLAVDALLRLIKEYNIGILFLQSGSMAHRRAAGEWAARTLINGAI